jgi:hypothetical protein
MDEVWVIITNETTVQLYLRLKPYILSGDALLITEIVKESGLPTGNLPPDLWAWINGWKFSNGGARSVLGENLPLPTPLPISPPPPRLT